MTDEHDEMTRFVYFAEGGMYLGTIEDYRDVWRTAHYAGLDVRPEVWVHSPDGGTELCLRKVEIKVGEYNENDYASVLFYLEGTTETAYATLDGRV